MPSWLLYGLLILCIPLYFFACTATSSSSDPEPNKFEYIVMAESFVEDILKAPSTAEFCPAHECSVSATDEGLVVVRGYVDAENSFGAMLRSDYAVEMLVDDDSDKYTLVYLMFGTEEVGTYISGDFNLLK